MINHSLAGKWIDANPFSSAAAKRGECTLAAAQAFLATSCWLSLWLDVGAANRSVVRPLMLFYAGFSILLLILIRMRTGFSPRLRMLCHIVGILWPPVIFLFTGRPSGPFVVFLVFIAFAAAYRWSFSQAVATVLACCTLALVASGGPSAIALLRPLTRQMWASSGVITAGITLLLVGVMGYLAHVDKRARAAALTISRAIGSTQSELGIRKTIEVILGAIADLFSAKCVVLVLMDANGGRSLRWETRGRFSGRPSPVEYSHLPAPEAQKYFLTGLGQGWNAIRLHRSPSVGSFHCLALEEAGTRSRDVPGSFLEEFLILHDFRSLLGVALSFGKWSGRLLVFDPRGSGEGDSELEFLQALVSEVGPAVSSQFDLTHLRSRVRAAERARVARELHDGVVQSLAGVEMRLAALQRSTLTNPEQVTKAVSQAQQVVRHEMAAVRQLMEQIRPLELSSKELLTCLTETVDRFRRDTAISARFVSDFDQVTLAPRVCSELIRIAQEALFNVRKHSLAKNVLVRLARADGHCKLVIADDGRGFEFSGRFSQAQLEATHKGPRVIRERVRSIGGELVIDSMPGHGTRLEISIPQEC